MMSPSTLVSIGEALWDLFPSGARFGGAPANLACHAAMLGQHVFLISRIGNDAYGHQAREFLAQRGVDLQFLQTDEQYPTGSVTVTLDGQGQPHYTIVRDVAWDHLTWSPDWKDTLSRAHAVCWGSLSQRSSTTAKSIAELLARTPPTSVRLFDINLRPPDYSRSVINHSLHFANALKLNEAELPIVADMLGLTGSPEAQLEVLARRFDLRLIAWTRGAHGSTLFADGQWSHEQGRPVPVADAVGAGDAFTAALLSGYLRKCPLTACHEWASRVAAYVCTQAGAVPDLPPDLRQPPT